MARAYVAVGSNIQAEANITRGLRRLNDLTHISAIATFFHSEAIGRPEQPSYTNGVVAIEASLPPVGIKLGILRKIESEVGRRRGADRYAARELDLDLILFGDLVLDGDDLVLPDPEIYLRPFLAIPLLELDPLLVLPDTGTPLSRIVQDMDAANIMPLRAFTETLRKEIGHEP